MTRTIRTLVVILVLDLMIGGGLWYASQWTIEKKTALASLHQMIADEEERARQSSVINRMLREARARHEDTARFLTNATEENAVTIVDSLERLSDATGLAVETSNYSLKPGDSAMRIELQTTGGWNETYHFLRLIESYPGVLVLTRAGLQSEGGSAISAGSKWRGSPISLELRSVIGGHEYGQAE
jgi:hypothetical protein